MKFFSDRVLLVLFGIVSLYTYTLFWIFFFNSQKTADTIATPPKVLSSRVYEPVVREGGLEENTEQGIVAGVKTLQESYTITVIPRKQKFNLSCEFAAAASIIYHFTQDPKFSVENSVEAEKTLMEKVGVSNNPNLGIRMGEVLGSDLSTLYTNLNQRFGGADFYGVHAPPFLDVFTDFGLQAKVLQPDTGAKEAMQKAIFENHLVMAWIKLGFGKPVDIELAYGSVPVIRGEHVVVVQGYDEAGFFVMDPGTGMHRRIAYKSFFEAIRPFSMPLLEVYQTVEPKTSLEDVFDLGRATGLTRQRLKIAVENGSRKIGAGSELSSILMDFGYTVTSMKNAKEEEYEGLTIRVKPALQDYLYLLRKDLTLAEYDISSSSADLSEETSEDAVIVVGE